MNHSFDVGIATKYGVNAAIILNNLAFWILHNKANDRCFYEGRYWTYNSVKAFAELFPYMSDYNVRGALQRLLDDGIIVKGCFNKTGMDRTTWYAITEKGERLLGWDCSKDDTEVAQENPFGDYDSEAGIPDTVEAYAARNLDRMTPGNMQEFGRYKEKLPQELIRHAIDEACANSARSWAYVRKILDNYICQGFKTMGQVLAAEEAKSRRRQRISEQQGQDDNPLLRTKFY